MTAFRKQVSLRPESLRRAFTVTGFNMHGWDTLMSPVPLTCTIEQARVCARLSAFLRFIPERELSGNVIVTPLSKYLLLMG
jgi:hypothetical protein